jgi:carbamate kinase
MAPKVRAALQFIENGGKKCIITESKELGKDNVGTQIVA